MHPLIPWGVVDIAWRQLAFVFHAFEGQVAVFSPMTIVPSDLVNRWDSFPALFKLQGYCFELGELVCLRASYFVQFISEVYVTMQSEATMHEFVKVCP